MLKRILVMLLYVLLFSQAAIFCQNDYELNRKKLLIKNLSSLQKMAQEQNNEPLLRAIRATNSLYQRYKQPGINKVRFLQAAYYIEAHKNLIKNSLKPYFTKKDTGLKHHIEHDPITGHVFIVLENKKSYIGRGKKKTVHKTIHYLPDPKVLARSQQSLLMDDEFKAHKALQGAPGLMNAHAFTVHQKDGKKYYTLYSDCYKGTLKSIIHKKRVSFKNKLIIMTDLLRGLESLHSRGYVHRDLHLANYLIFEESSKTIRAVIADLGRTIKIDRAKGLPGQMTKRLTAPEGFKQKKLKGPDYFATDVFALGSIFYWLYHNEAPKWQGEFLRSKKLPSWKKKALLVKKLKKETQKRLKKLQKRGGALSAQEAAEQLILKMISINPQERGSASQLRHSMQAILNKT